MTQAASGVIWKGIGGFYYVKLADEPDLLECKPRGIFRKRGMKPLPGDEVRLGWEAGTCFIDEILPRRNALVRPPVANVDQLVIVASTTEPVPSFLVLDKLCAMALDQEIWPLVVVSKTDLAPADAIMEAYANSGIPCVEAGELAWLRQQLAGRFSVLCGNSGVGKSTLLNALLPGLERETAQISKKLGRGRHTTREVELFALPGDAGGLVADTPGFASFDVHSGGAILADNLQLCFPEIKERIGQCRFSGCVHVAEAGCAVRAAAEAGEIAASRYQSYVTLYQQAKENEQRY